MFQRNKTLTSFSQTLRRNMTPQERRLWYDFLKQLPLSVRRQFTIHRYIVDFYIPAKQVVIELDGSQHYDAEEKQKDEERDTYLNRVGLRVLRYSNAEVNENFEGVCTDILKEIGSL